MALTTHRKKKDLTHTTEVRVAQQVDRDDIVQDYERVTFPTNVRVDNHLRNKITALINLGIAPNTKAVIEYLVKREEEKLGNNGELLRYQRMLSVLEERDSVSRKLKAKTKAAKKAAEAANDEKDRREK
ncbi:DUF5388 domain-containing protein [Clostridium faecium]|uniref:Uncharacterized protein n=1 Tax=Clostridium faecium TaxID=2762223 RepID=A0ABR8YMJ6_9CLOT|nr:DUF5388 domain-containing protein [Clostridium faecium]MBD8045440.1 hypothetical protein [Clostridium faecium]